MNKNNLKTILDFFYDEEIGNLEEYLSEQFEIEELPENLQEAIEFLENKNITNHIAYNLMILKRDLQNE